MLLLGARATLKEGKELVAEIEKSGVRDAAIHADRFEDLGVERDGFLEVVHLESDVVDPDETRLHNATIVAPAVRCRVSGSGRGDFRP